MLRPTLNRHLGLLLSAFQHTTIATGTRATVQKGGGDIGWTLIDTDAVEAASTAVTINATGHSAVVGDRILFRSGNLANQSRLVTAKAANTITVEDGLSEAPATGDAFQIQRLVTRVSAGKAQFTLRKPGDFIRGPIVLASPGPNIADGGFATIETVPASGVITTEMVNAGGVADDGEAHVILAGFLSRQTDTVKLQNVQASWPGPILHGYRITNDGTVAVASGGTQATAVRNGTGDVTLTFSPTLGNAYAAIVTPIKANASGAVRGKIEALSSASVQVTTFDDSGTAEDVDFMLIVAVTQMAVEFGGGRGLLQVPQRKSKIIIGSITVDKGLPTLAIGGDTNGVDFTLSDEGAGLYQLTCSPVFMRQPVVVATGLSTACQIEATPVDSVFQISCSDAAGSFGDDTRVDFLVLGYDSEDEI